MTSTTPHRWPPPLPAVPEVLRRWPALPRAGLVLLAAAVLGTAALNLSMRDMGELPMPGGWTLSAAWMPMCGQSWAGAAASFTGMWAVMMVAMMLPALLPVLRQGPPPSAALVGAGYFFVWAALGALVFGLGAALTQLLLHINAVARLVPMLAGLVVLLGGAFQFTAWKARRLAFCRQPPMYLPLRPTAAWRQGLQLGQHCVASCAGLTAMLLVMGVMDLGAMAVVTAAITAERLAPHGQGVARAVGAVALAAGLMMTARSAWPA